ncbi:GlxA family transcriptional regulator [Hahella sp. NBU794]|uniref:GlxA family transcriptional regulator n=1 Tax=Hahella sp. NBU794 TaxID=3422590 RepID=UPI003D6EC500
MHVTVLMVNQCSSASIAITLETLACANQFRAYRNRSQEPLFNIQTASLDGHPVSCSGGLTLTPNVSLEQITGTDLIVIPGFLFNLKPALPTFKDFAPWLRARFAEQAAIATICTGAFLLAESGLLDDMAATTHWYYVNAFAQRYPKVKVSKQHIITEDNRIICSGGASAAIDLLLHIIRRYAAPEIAAECSKKLLIDTTRREQTPYVMLSFNKNHEDREILKVQDWLDHHYASAINIEELAKQFGFGVRNFKRRFKDATGQTPINYLQNLRIENAKRLIETTRMSIESITFEVGYEDSNSFRRLFSERVGTTPSSYRKKFQVPPPGGQTNRA